MEQLAGHLYGALVKQLASDYAIVQEPGPGVMRIRLALTEARRSKLVLDLVTTVLPQALALSTVKRLATGTHSFVGRAGIEAEIVDSVTGERLLAAVDKRAGRKALRGQLKTWDDVKSAYDYWAQRTQARLRELRMRRPR